VETLARSIRENSFDLDLDAGQDTLDELKIRAECFPAKNRLHGIADEVFDTLVQLPLLPVFDRFAAWFRHADYSRTFDLSYRRGLRLRDNEKVPHRFLLPVSICNFGGLMPAVTLSFLPGDSFFMFLLFVSIASFRTAIWRNLSAGPCRLL
jgi:hypothetical protein